MTLPEECPNVSVSIIPSGQLLVINRYTKALYLANHRYEVFISSMPVHVVVNQHDID